MTLFIWGAVLGPLWVVATAVEFRLGARYIAGSSAPKRSRFARMYPMWALMGVPFGAVSAAMSTSWPDILWTAYAVAALVLPLAALPRLRRKAADAGCASGKACAGCPIACDRAEPARMTS